MIDPKLRASRWRYLLRCLVATLGGYAIALAIGSAAALFVASGPDGGAGIVEVVFGRARRGIDVLKAI